MKTYRLDQSWKRVRLSKEAEEKMEIEPGFYKMGQSSKDSDKVVFLLKAGFGIKVPRPSDCLYFIKTVKSNKAGEVRKKLKESGYVDWAVKYYP